MDVGIILPQEIDIAKIFKPLCNARRMMQSRGVFNLPKDPVIEEGVHIGTTQAFYIVMYHLLSATLL